MFHTGGKKTKKRFFIQLSAILESVWLRGPQEFLFYTHFEDILIDI